MTPNKCSPVTLPGSHAMNRMNPRPIPSGESRKSDGCAVDPVPVCGARPNPAYADGADFRFSTGNMISQVTTARNRFGSEGEAP